MGQTDINVERSAPGGIGRRVLYVLVLVIAYLFSLAMILPVLYLGVWLVPAFAMHNSVGDWFILAAVFGLPVLAVVGILASIVLLIRRRRRAALWAMAPAVLDGMLLLAFVAN